MKMELNLNDDDLAFLEREARRGGYFGVADCLHGIMNAALLSARREAGDMSPEQAQREALVKLLERKNTEIRVLKGLLSESMEATIELDKENRLMRGGAPEMFGTVPFVGSDRYAVKPKPGHGLMGELEEDPGGGMRHRDEAEGGDLDDEIPF